MSRSYHGYPTEDLAVYWLIIQFFGQIKALTVLARKNTTAKFVAGYDGMEPCMSKDGVSGSVVTQRRKRRNAHSNIYANKCHKLSLGYGGPLGSIILCCSLLISIQINLNKNVIIESRRNEQEKTVDGISNTYC